jgi:glycosyltransferase involved in cell wall biosynthesis
VPKRRIVEVVTGLGMGGAEKALSARLRYASEDIESVIFNHRSKLDQIPFSKEIKIVVSSNNFLLMSYKFFELAKTFEPDYVIVRTPLDAIRFSFLKSLSKKTRWKLVFEAHSNFITSKNIFNNVLARMLKLSQKSIDLTIAVSENVQVGPLCLFSTESEVLYLGGDIEIGNPNFSDSMHPRLIFLGRLVEIKNPLLLVSAICQIKDKINIPDGFLKIVGEGPLMGSLSSYISDNKLEKIVQLVGYQDDVSRFLLEATHLISVSHNEGLPISFFEAKLAGLRIVSTPSGGGSEIFDKFDYELRSFDISELV